MNKIKSHIIEQHGTINKFLDANQQRMTTSRTHMYKLINMVDANPTISTMKELAELTGLSMEEITHEFSSYRHREPREGTEGQD